MEDERNDNELEERLYAMIHYVDESVTDNNDQSNELANNILKNTPNSSVRRYWRTSGDNNTNTQYQKVNKPVNTIEHEKTLNTPVTTPSNPDKLKSLPTKEEKNTEDTNDCSLFDTSQPEDAIITVKIIEHDDSANTIELQSSDEDEVIEIALPPKPTITIESSDEEVVPTETKSPINLVPPEKPKNVERDSSSPVPSVVSSVSDDFIRGDCIALNISSWKPQNNTFDFSLHGSDLLDQATPRKKKKKKNKEAQNVAETPKPHTATENCFATPNSKKKQKKNLYSVSKSIPNADVYDSDSNQSVESAAKVNYSVTEKSCPSADIYESDNDSFSDKQKIQKTTKNIHQEKKKDTTACQNQMAFVDLTDDVPEESDLVMANVTGFSETSANRFTESNDYDDNSKEGPSNLVPSEDKTPAILYEDLDFDMLKGKGERKFSLRSLEADMSKFYNESWGGENFNHKEIQKNMSRDKKLWAIDPKDKMVTPMKRRLTCNYCNRVGHRDSDCRMKPPKCHMCGDFGHYETRCPNKICVNCGSPNYMYSTICRNCASWNRITCNECRQVGHPASHCPDLWRRYHNTTDTNTQLEIANMTKRHQLFCSGCTKKGHLVHVCRSTLPFSGLPINSPFVFNYRPVYPITSTSNSNQAKGSEPQTSNQAPYQNDRSNKVEEISPKQLYSTISTEVSEQRFNKNNENKGKRQSKSPCHHETHSNKVRRVSNRSNNSESKDDNSATKVDPFYIDTNRDINLTDANKARVTKEANTDKNGQIIQDNQVSDTSLAITTCRVYLTDDIRDKLKTSVGEDWLNDKRTKYNLSIVEANDNNSLNVTGSIADQDQFQADLREWVNSLTNTKVVPQNSQNSATSDKDCTKDNTELSSIPKNREYLLNRLNSAFDSLKYNIGDPQKIFKELNYLKSQGQKLIAQKIVSPKQLANNRENTKAMQRKLNMVLLGQAGLGGGLEHLQELHAFMNQVDASKEKEIPMRMRKEIAKHYSSIFTCMPRDDYKELINMYYRGNHNSIAKKNKIGKRLKRRLKEQGDLEGNDVIIHHENPAINQINYLNPRKALKRAQYVRIMLRRFKPMASIERKMKQDLGIALNVSLAALKDPAARWTPERIREVNDLVQNVQNFLTSMNYKV